MALHDLPRRARAALSLSAPSWARPWRRPAPDASRTGPSIAVLGNCQARGVAQAMRLLAPRSPVRLLAMGSLGRDYADLDDLARALSAYEYVFSQTFPGGLLPGGDSEALRARAPRLRLFPTIVFSAFHPDMVYLGRGPRDLAPSPLGQYHSAIAVCAHRLGLDVARTVGLFRKDVFRRLGYFEFWEPSVREVVGAGAAAGFGLERELGRWSRRGAFMHVMNHPKAFVLGDIARRLLAEGGLAPETVAIEDYLGDELARDVVWPIYPPVAELYGLTGSYLFKARPAGGAFPRLYDLAEFVAASFALYDAAEPGSLANARVDAWLAMPALVAMFRAG